MAKLRQRGRRSSASVKQRNSCFMEALRTNEIKNGKKAYASKS